ncbi:MAG: hypothetical protein RJA14_1369 [Pseudomonadota bacterium]
MIKRSLQHSDIRFCQKATELPYRRLVRYREFTVAIAATSQSRQFPATEPVIPEANGVLHGASTYGDGTAQPMLPVSIAFLDRSAGANEPIGSGRLDTHYGHEDRFYCLRLSILDPGHQIFASVDRALERAALSQERFIHLRCRNADVTDERGSISEQHDEERAFLKTLENEEASFPQIRFDQVSFCEGLLLASSLWAGAWPSFEEGGARFRDPRTAKWRKGAAKWAK